MVRTGVLALTALASSGCSLILDFSGSGEPPVDAPFTDAECMYKEPNDTPATATTLELTDVGPAAICPQGGNDDRDVYKVTLPASTMVSFKITYAFSTTGDLDIQLTDTQGSMISSSRSFDNDETILC